MATRRGRILVLAISFAAAAAVLAVRPEESVAGYLVRHGYPPSTAFGALTAHILPPALITALAAACSAIYEFSLWPLLHKGKSGWWLYALRSSNQHRVVGLFRLSDSPWGCRVSDGRAYYISSGGKLTQRGSWQADRAWCDGDQIDLLFVMNSSHSKQNDSPSNYIGHISIRPDHKKGAFSPFGWVGMFYDLEDRAGIFGPVYCERAFRFGGNARKAYEKLEHCAVELAKRVPSRA